MSERYVREREMKTMMRDDAAEGFSLLFAKHRKSTHTAIASVVAQFRFRFVSLPALVRVRVPALVCACGERAAIHYRAIVAAAYEALGAHRQPSLSHSTALSTRALVQYHS